MTVIVWENRFTLTLTSNTCLLLFTNYCFHMYVRLSSVYFLPSKAPLSFAQVVWLTACTFTLTLTTFICTIYCRVWRSISETRSWRYVIPISTCILVSVSPCILLTWKEICNLHQLPPVIHVFNTVVCIGCGQEFINFVLHYIADLDIPVKRYCALSLKRELPARSWSWSLAEVLEG